MKMSFIIPVYNTEQYILNCLKSIPERKDVEVILINDCSTDDSKEIIEEYIKNKKNFKLINLEINSGPGVARNKGIDIAKGDYLYFLDSDDSLLEDINKLLDLTVERPDIDIFYCGMRFKDGRILFKRDKRGVIRCIKRSFVGETRYPPKRYEEDQDFYKEVMKKNPNKLFTELLVYYYNYPRVDSQCWKRDRGISLENTKLTIIVPVYNNEKNIKRCLDSIELTNDIEIIIIDDCSTDNSAKIVEKWIKNSNFNKIKFIKNEVNLGVGGTVNKGYDNMSGEYVITLCDDDYFICPLTEFIKELTGEDLIYYNMRINSGKIWRGIENPGSTKAFKKTIIGDNRRINQNFGGDKVFYQEILAKNPTKKETDITLYHYNYPRKGSLMDQWRQTYKDFNITIYTEVHNGYGIYLKEWLESINKQKIKPKEVIIVLGKDHGANTEELSLDSIDLKIIKHDSENIGELRNQAIKKANTDWILYFSADDILLPNAIEEIRAKSSICDVVFLRYIIGPRNAPMKSALMRINEIMNWDKNSYPGYLALKRKHKGKILYYEETEVPNYPYIFNLAYLDLTMYHTDAYVAVFKKRQGSHGDTANKKNIFKTKYTKYINERALYYTRKYKSEYKKRDMIRVEPLESFIATKEGVRFIKGRIELVTRQRALELSTKNNRAKRPLVKIL